MQTIVYNYIYIIIFDIVVLYVTNYCTLNSEKISLSLFEFGADLLLLLLHLSMTI